jgi:hypothetical protein
MPREHVSAMHDLSKVFGKRQYKESSIGPGLSKYQMFALRCKRHRANFAIRITNGEFEFQSRARCNDCQRSIRLTSNRSRCPMNGAAVPLG